MKLESIDLPVTVSSIGSLAFRGCSSLKEIKLPSLLVAIGDSAFAECTSLESFYIPMQIRSISNGMLKNCKSLGSLLLSPQIQSVGVEAFAGCEKLTSMEFPDGIETLPYGIMAGCTALESVVIPSTVETIETQAFMGCKSLKAVEFPERLTAIGNFAFDNCASLTSVVVPDGVTALSQNSFSNCTELTEITLPDGIETIGYQAVGNCPKLTELRLPYGVTIIDPMAFDGCTGLTTVYMPSPEFRVRAENIFNGCTALTDVWFNTEQPVTVKFDETVTPALHVPYGFKDVWSAAYPNNIVTECGTIHSSDDMGYATYFTTAQYTMPAGFTGYTAEVSETTDYELQLTAAYAEGSVVPSGTGLVVKGNGPGTVMFDVTAPTGSGKAPATNMLRGTDRREVFEGTREERYYKLSYNDSEDLGFFYGVQGGREFENGAHEAYLAVPIDDSSARGYVLEDIPSGIGNVEVPTEGTTVNAVYTIDGIRLNVTDINQLQPGLYIINGRKQLIK